MTTPRPQNRRGPMGPIPPMLRCSRGPWAGPAGVPAGASARIGWERIPSNKPNLQGGQTDANHLFEKELRRKWGGFPPVKTNPTVPSQSRARVRRRDSGGDQSCRAQVSRNASGRCLTWERLNGYSTNWPGRSGTRLVADVRDFGRRADCSSRSRCGRLVAPVWPIGDAV